MTGHGRFTPGYGSFYANQHGAKLDPTLELVSFEILKRGLKRYFAFERQTNGKIFAVDDFVAQDIWQSGNAPSPMAG